MLHLLLGTDWTRNREEILARISSDVGRKQSTSLLIVPELITHDTERRLCAAAGDTASRYAEVLSFSRLALRVADSVGCAMGECLDNGGRVVTMAAASRMQVSHLKAYAAVETKPEFLTGLVDAVDEFKRCCISANDLRAASAQADGTLAQKLEELSLLLESYDSLCAQGKRDPRDLMSWLLELMQQAEFGSDRVFYIDGFPDFTRQHMAILEHLIQVSPHVTVSLNCDQVNTRALAFEKAGETAGQLLRIAEKAGVEVEIIQIPAADTCLQTMCRKLFQGAISEDPSLRGHVRLIQAQSTWQECVAAAERIMELAKKGSRYRDISVVCTDLNVYRPLLSMVFHRCGIPVYLSGTEDILEKSAVSTILSAMDAAAGDFEQRDVFRYLRCILSPLDPDTCDLVENYGILWNIQGKGWLQDWKFHPDGLVQDWTEEDRRRLAELNQARESAIAPLERMRKGFSAARSLADQVQTLYAFLEDIGLEQKLSKLAEELDADGDNRGAQELNQLWEIILGAMEQMFDALGKTVWDTDSFIRLFKLLLSQYDVGTIPTVLDSVTVGPVNAMRCQQQKHLFVLGAAEGSLPGYGGSAGVLSDQERTALRKMGVPLTGGAIEGLQAEFAEIYGVFCGAEETVTVTYPAGEPSMVYKRLLKMVGKEENPTSLMGSVLKDPVDAAAWLVKCNAVQTAEDLQLSNEYYRAQEQISYALGSVENEYVRGLYGNKLRLSASQVDRLAECRLYYFLQYGLRAKERKEAAVDPAEFGTFVHAVLEQTGREIRDMGGFQKVSMAETLEIAKRYAAAYASERFAQLDSPRLSYLFQRNAAELEMVVQELWQELHLSEFSPVEFELKFGIDGVLPPIEIEGGALDAQLRGVVDRVDRWKGPGVDYFRVVDYKTGKKDFDYCDVFNGLGLQMLLYLFVLENYAAEQSDKMQIPAGVQYFPARIPVISADGKVSEAEAEKLRLKQLRRKGLLLDDEAVLQAMEPGDAPQRLDYSVRKDGSRTGDLATREQLAMLKQYVFQVLRGLVDDIASGNVTPNPYTRGTSHSACAFCPYGAVCHKEEVEGRRNYKTMIAQRFWEEVEKEVRNHG